MENFNSTELFFPYWNLFLLLQKTQNNLFGVNTTTNHDIMKKKTLRQIQPKKKKNKFLLARANIYSKKRAKSKLLIK